MIYLLIAICFGSLFAILFKWFSQWGISSLQAIAINYATAFLVGILVNVIQGTFVVRTYADVPLLPALLVGVCMMGGFVTMDLATRSHGVAIATISSRVSFIIPVFCSFLLLGDDRPDWLALALVLIAVILFNLPGVDSSTTRVQHRASVAPLLVFLFYGMANFLLNYAQRDIRALFPTDEAHCNAAFAALTSMAFASALICTLVYALLRHRDQLHFTGKSIGAGILLGMVNMGCTFFLLKSLNYLSAALFYPVYNISIVLVALAAGRWLFREKLTFIHYAGVAVSLVAIVLFFT